MKILFLTNIPAPYRVDFFNELGKHCDLTVLYERESSLERNADWKAGENKTFRSVFLKGIRTGVDNGFSTQVLSYIRKFRDQRIIVGGYSTPTAMLAIAYMKWRKIPYFLNADGGQIAEDSKLRFRVKQFLIRGAAGYLSTGSQTDAYFIHYGAEKDKLHRYPFTSVTEADVLPAVTGQEERNRLRKQLGLPEDQKIVIAVGQFIHRKGFDLLLDLWKEKKPPYLLLLIGGGPLGEVFAQNKSDNVRLVDFQKKDTLALYYQASDLFVLPTREDIWGLVINEAMANGLPIISTDRCVAAVELIENGKNGYVVPVEDREQTFRAIEIIFSEEDRGRKMGAHNIQKIAQHYTIEEMARTVAAIRKEEEPLHGIISSDAIGIHYKI